MRPRFARRCSARILVVLVLTLCSLVAVSSATAARAASRGTTVLTVGEALGISGTDMVCAFGGPVNQIGLACLHTGSNAASVYSFRIDETNLQVFKATSSSGVIRLGVWKEPAAGIAEGRSAAVSKFKSVGQVPVGGHFEAAGSDLSCEVYSFTGVVQVACFKVNARGALNGSYGVGLGGSTVQVSRFEGGRGTTAFVGGPGK